MRTSSSTSFRVPHTTAPAAASGPLGSKVSLSASPTDESAIPAHKSAMTATFAAESLSRPRMTLYVMISAGIALLMISVSATDDHANCQSEAVSAAVDGALTAMLVRVISPAMRQPTGTALVMSQHGDKRGNQKGELSIAPHRGLRRQ